MDEIIKRKKQTLSQERWKQLIIECQSSGLTVQDYCQQQGLCKSTYYKWQRELRLDACKASVPQPIEDAHSLVKLDYPLKAAYATVPKQATGISISFGAAKIEVPQGADPETIKIVLNTLAKLCF